MSASASASTSTHAPASTSTSSTRMFASLTPTSGSIHASAAQGSKWQGFKVVGDNIDKNVRRRHQTLERTTKSLHYFNTYAVADRVDFSGLSESRPEVSLTDQLADSLLPTEHDLQQLLLHFEVHVSRILAEHLKPLQRLAEVVVKHIPHKYSGEMAQKSLVVSKLSLYIVCSYVQPF